MLFACKDRFAQVMEQENGRDAAVKMKNAMDSEKSEFD